MIIVTAPASIYDIVVIARLILSLLLVFASLPAMATGQGCHEQPAGRVIAMAAMAAMAAMPGMPAHPGSALPAEHHCIGCMPVPDAPRARAVAAPPRVRLPRPLPVRFDLRATGPPALPPPRIG